MSGEFIIIVVLLSLILLGLGSMLTFCKILLEKIEKLEKENEDHAN